MLHPHEDCTYWYIVGVIFAVWGKNNLNCCQSLFLEAMN
jgi:hypothetical protein